MIPKKYVGQRMEILQVFFNNPFFFSIFFNFLKLLGVIFKNSPCVQLFSTDKKTLISKYFHQDHKKPITDIEFGVKDS